MRRRNPRNPQTETPASSAAFRRWFGDSKVVDAAGEPLVVYHAGFDVLRSSDGVFRLSHSGRAGMGIYFTPSFSGAERYLGRAHAMHHEHVKIAKYDGLPVPPPPAITSVYLSVQNPAIVDRRDGLEPSESLASKVVPKRRYRNFDYELEDLLRYTRKAGYDGVFVVNGEELEEIVVFDPRQVKSATANRGTFDPADPDLRRNPEPSLTRRRNPEPTVEVYRDRHGDIAAVTVRLAGGSVSAIRSRFDKPDVMHVGWSELPESARGKGLGVQMYAALMDWALANNITLTSDEALSPAAGRVWEALAKRGYPIQKHPTARLYTEDDRSAWGADDRNKPFTLKRRNPRRVGFLEHFNAATVPSDLSRRGRMFPGVPVSIELSHEVGDNYITLDRFAAQPGIRGTGAGTDAMRRLLDLADMHNLVVYLQPAPLDTGWPKKRLTDWYSSFGFAFEEGSEYGDMMRLPQAKGARRPNPRPTTAERTDPALWEAVKREVTAGSKGGKPGQWSARKAQLAVALYRQRGGGYWGPKDPRNSLAKWTREKWRTKSGRPSLETGERYLPSKAIAALTDAEYAATTRAKRAGMRKGQQFVPQPEDVALKVRAYRRNTRRRNPHQQGHGIDPRLLAADGARYFSDEALAEADQEAGSSKSRTALVLMRPRDFLAMAEPGMREESQAALERVLDAGVRLSDVPRLFIATSRTDPHRAVVTGHEGRHRSRALLARGVTQMPVRIHSQDIRWGEQTDPESWDYDPVLPSVLVGEGANRHNTLPMPVPLHYPELAPRLHRSRTNPRRKR